MTPRDYWASGEGLGNITPRGKEWPEGDGFADLLRRVVEPDAVLEFGCGIGRLAGLFDPGRYVGVDICPGAIQIAKAARPEYDFRLDEGDLPKAGVTLAHTVLLHVPDEELPGVVRRFTSPRVIVSEILGRKWRRAGNPPVFNREAEDYIAAFDGFSLFGVYRCSYPHYRDTDLTMLEFVRC